MQDWPWVFDYGDVIYIYMYLFLRGYPKDIYKHAKNVRKILKNILL